MIQLVAVAAVGVVGLYAWKELRRHLSDIDREERERLMNEGRPKERPTLRKDPDTGRYRPDGD